LIKRGKTYKRELKEGVIEIETMWKRVGRILK
jgi:hypothetical protein